MDKEKSLLPISYQSKLMLALEEIIRESETLAIGELKDFWDPRKCREDLLPYLASYLGVTKWDSNVAIEQKRQGCINALTINKQRGTLASLKLALKSLNLNATIVEWWQAQGQAGVTPAPENKEAMGEGRVIEKGWADIILQENEIIYSEEQYKRIYKLIDEVKRLSLHITIKKQSPIKGSYYIGGANYNIAKTKIKYEVVKSKLTEFNKTIRITGAMQNSRRVTIW